VKYSTGIMRFGIVFYVAEIMTNSGGRNIIKQYALKSKGLFMPS